MQINKKNKCVLGFSFCIINEFQLVFPKITETTKQNHIWINFPFEIRLISAARSVRILLNYFIFIQQKESWFLIFPALALQSHSKHLNLSQKSISSFNRFLLESRSRHIFKAVYVLPGVGWQLAWSVDWHLRVDRQPPSTVASTRDKCDEQRGRERSRPVIDTGATARGQSHASKNGAIDSHAL